MVDRSELLAWCEGQLQPGQFKDYAPNGLQVEGRTQVQTVVCAVSASQAAIEAAVAHQADMLLVHHCLFWKSEPVQIVGWKKQRISLLLQHEINLVGYHLPLDAHPQWGNNAQLARVMDWQIEAQTGEQSLLMLGRLAATQRLTDFSAALAQRLGRTPVVVGEPMQSISRLAWCTGGAQGYFQAAIDLGVDAFVTGEISESQYHLARETGVAFVSAGHHATERYGVQALGQALARQFGVNIFFADEANPA